MLRTLKNLFDQALAPAAAPDPAADARALQLATAVLLVEVMRADAAIHADERRAVVEALGREFGLGAEVLDALVAEAEVVARDATDLHAFTSRLNAQMDMAARLRIVELLWRVAYADGHLDAHERHVLWRIADLLHVPHGAYIHAKMRARDAAGGGTGG